MQCLNVYCLQCSVVQLFIWLHNLFLLSDSSTPDIYKVPDLLSPSRPEGSPSHRPARPPAARGPLPSLSPNVSNSSSPLSDFQSVSPMTVGEGVGTERGTDDGSEDDIQVIPEITDRLFSAKVDESNNQVSNQVDIVKCRTCRCDVAYGV